MRMTNLLKLTVVGIFGVTVACSVSPEMDANMARQTENAIDLKQKAAVPGDPIPDDVVRVKNDIWLGDTSTIEFEGQPVPAYLETKDGITLISNRPITLYEIGSMINKITSISVRYAPELEETAISNADNNQPAMEDLGVQWTDSTKMIVNYKGPISGLLDEVANRFGIWWKYEKNEIYFYKYITKTFVLYSLPTNPSMSVSVGGSGGSASISQSSSIGDMDMWGNMESSISSMVTSDSNLVMDKANGTITLTATPTDIRRVAKYINEQNMRVSKQVAISVKVIQVNITNEDRYSLDLAATFGGRGSIRDIAANTNGGEIDDAISNLTMGISSSRWSVDAAMQALSEEGQTNLVTSGTVTTMNNKPAPIQVVKTQNYISEITKTSDGDSSNYDISVETDQIETGFTMSVLPRILDHGRVMMFFNLTLSDLLSLDAVNITSSGDSDSEDGSSSSGESQYIQNPVIETRGFTQEVAMKSGETLILAGYERVENTSDKQGVGSPENNLLGGSSSATKDRTILVIMLTPVVLESPLSPESRMN
jgi:type IVB pilus formation R64 PilN family outer membrane protein